MTIHASLFDKLTSSIITEIESTGHAIDTALLASFKEEFKFILSTELKVSVTEELDFEQVDIDQHVSWMRLARIEQVKSGLSAPHNDIEETVKEASALFIKHQGVLPTETTEGSIPVDKEKEPDVKQFFESLEMEQYIEWMEYAREHLTATSGHNFDVDDVIVKATQLFSELKGIHPVHKAKEHAVNLAFDLNSDSNSDVKEAVPAQTIYDLIADTDETTIEYEGTTYALTPYYDMSNIEAIKLMIDTYHAFLPTKGNSEK